MISSIILFYPLDDVVMEIMQWQTALYTSLPFGF